MIANVPGSVPAGIDAVHNERAARLRREPEPRCRADDRRSSSSRRTRTRSPRAGRGRGTARVHGGSSRAAVSPARGWCFPTARWQPSRRRFPTVTGTIVRRTPLRLVVPQRRHFHLDDVPPAEPVRGRLDARRLSDAAPARCSRSSAASTRASASTARTSTSQYRAARAGWERWYVPEAVVRHEHKAVTDKRWLTRRTLWHWAGIARFVRKHPERLRAL